MSKLSQIPQYSDNHYAVVDLGSNSFHLLITKLVDNEVVVVDKIKRKVRLAAGLNNDNELSPQAIRCGLECISLFAEHLASIPKKHIRIVATATLRIATNSDDFINDANKILPINIKLLSGKQEANTIYSGVAHTCDGTSTNKRLILDIGGASTELIIGEGYTALHAISLNLGCVSFNQRFFENGQLTTDSFDRAIIAASKIITPVVDSFTSIGWHSVLGGSGTMQALAEIQRHRQQEPVFSAYFIAEIKQALIDFKTVDSVYFPGLRADRVAVLASGLSILIALYQCLAIKELALSSGALREGLLFEMLAK